MKHGLYPSDPKERYNAERVVEVVTTHCSFYTIPSGYWE